MFGGGGQPSGEDILEATKITATAFMEHYNKTVESCYNKCILKYAGVLFFHIPVILHMSMFTIFDYVCLLILLHCFFLL